jgi:hypothetical protein
MQIIIIIITINLQQFTDKNEDNLVQKELKMIFLCLETQTEIACPPPLLPPASRAMLTAAFSDMEVCVSLCLQAEGNQV